MSFNIGNVTIDIPVILAPMSGVTDLPMRRLVRKFGGVGLVVSEMIASQAALLDTRKSLQKSSGADERTSMQLAGCDPYVVAEAAKIHVDRGAKIIDINFGCPAKKIAINSYAGSALMRDVPLAARILEETVKAVDVPVTVKMRMGWDHSSLNAPELARIAEDVGIKMVTVHGRTRSQLYTGIADWEFIASVKDAIKIPVIANGDIKTVHDAVKALKQSKADGIMIGRGIYGRPWFISQVSHYLKTKEILPDPSIEEQLKIILEHYDDIIEYYSPEVGVKIARKHVGWYSSGLHGSAEFRSGVNTVDDHKIVRDMIVNFYAKFI